MLPAVFPLLKASSAVTALLGTNPTRAYPHGTAPQNVAGQYVTWSIVTGLPQNTIDEAPRIDAQTVQVNCWSAQAGTSSKDIEALATAVRDAIEPTNHMVAGPANGQDPETKRYFIRMDFTFWNHRSTGES